MPTVSIAMATFNGAKHIRRQLDSLAKQTQLPAELVITDDGSTDDTLSIVADFAKTAPFPVHVHKNPERLNFRANFMKAANLCKSDLIAFCDQDDVWRPKKIQCCANALGEDVYFVHHNADVVNSAGEKIGTLDSFARDKMWIPPLDFNPMDPTPGFTQMFNRCLLEFSDLWPSSRDHRSPNEPMAHDQWFRFLAVCTGRTVYIHGKLASYYQHDDNLVGFIAAAGTTGKYQKPLKNVAAMMTGRIKALLHRAELLDQIAARLTGTHRAQATRAASEYRKLAELCGTRAMIYESRNPIRRASAFLDLVRSNAYGYSWGFSSRNKMKDALIGVTIGPYLKESN